VGYFQASKLIIKEGNRGSQNPGTALEYCFEILQMLMAYQHDLDAICSLWASMHVLLAGIYSYLSLVTVASL
jgi:hypothetical protein